MISIARFTFIMTLFLIATKGLSQSDVELYISGNQAILDKDYHAAITIFNDYLARNQHNEHAFLLRSEANYFFKNYKDVVKDCKRVFEIGDYPSEFDYTAMWNIANAYIGLGKYNKALPYLEIYKTRHPNKTNIYEVKAYTYFAKKDFKAAIQELEQLKKLDSNSVKAYYGIGRALAKQKKFSEALPFYNKAIALDPNYALAYENRGMIKIFLSDFNGGCEDLRHAFELGITGHAKLINKFCNRIQF